jgi:hypothetical protein
MTKHESKMIWRYGDMEIGTQLGTQSLGTQSLGTQSLGTQSLGT